MLNIIVTIICIALIAFILFWFFKKPEKSGQKAQQKNGYQEIRVEVMGGYTAEEFAELRDNGQIFSHSL